jgi:YVTN family beta-propeller protein
MLSTGIATTSHADTIFVSNEKDNTVTVLDSETMQVIKTIPTGLRPRGIVMSPDFKELLVCAGDDNRLDVIDTQTLEVTRTLPSGPDPWASSRKAWPSARTTRSRWPHRRPPAWRT